MLFTNKKEVQGLTMLVKSLEEQIENLKLQQDAHWKVLNSILQRLQAAPHGINKDGSPRKQIGRKAKEAA